MKGQWVVLIFYLLLYYYYYFSFIYLFFIFLNFLQGVVNFVLIGVLTRTYIFLHDYFNIIVYMFDHYEEKGFQTETPLLYSL